jgi:hypothetical protein
MNKITVCKELLLHLERIRQSARPEVAVEVLPLELRLSRRIDQLERKGKRMMARVSGARMKE